MLLSRRLILQNLSCGFGYLALQALAGDSLIAKEKFSLESQPAIIKPRAKRVIFLCMNGGPAQMDLFDYKPQTGNKKHPGSVFKFQQYGQSGHWISELLPYTASQADHLCVINGMYADTGIHAQSFLQLHTGERLRERPSMGAWINYGLGSENRNLPGFISMNTNLNSVFASSFLPSVYAGTPIGVNGESMSLATINNITGHQLSMNSKRQQLDYVQSLNQEHHLHHGQNDKLESVIQTMELGFRMQNEAPELLDISNETQKTLEQYQVGKHQNSIGTCVASDFGRQCLLARRFAEAGVRFIEINHGSWDQHKNHRRDLKANCEATDAPIAALLADLYQRGLLEETLVVWGGEFGRPGINPDADKDESGHNFNGFTFWLAGGGSNAGHVHGKTDPTGSRSIEGKVHFRDLHATILHLLGLSPNELTYHYAGRDHRLTGPEGGNIIHELIG
jgi:hypothetical protein